VSISVLVVDDHVVFAETLGAALKSVPDIDVVGTASTGADAVIQARDTTPDVALVDMLLGDQTGIELARQHGDVSPGTRIVILTASQDIAHYTEAMAAGVSGYLTKQAAFPEVTAAITAAHEGRVVVPSSVMERLLAAKAPTEGLGADLTPRELDVLALLGRGYDAKRAATTLGIRWHTCRSYIKNVLYKLDAHSALEAVRKATRLGILTPDGE
jgi:DNA-binding NarL/FixJ family response regulator